MKFSIKRDFMLKSLAYIQGVVEKKKYITDFIKCINYGERQKT